MKLRKTLARIRRIWRTVKGPPPRKHGVIPYDYEIRNLSAEFRPYLKDSTLMLRPGKPYAGLGEAVQLRPITHILDASRCCNCAGYKPQPIHDPLELYHD